MSDLRSRILHARSSLAITMLIAAAAPPASAAGGTNPYREFASCGHGAHLLRIARSALLAAIGLEEEGTPAEPSGESGRPAGPRDDPPPPEWPDGPTGLIVCLRVKGTVRACEASLPPPSPDLGEAVSILAGKVPSSGSRGRTPRLRASDRASATLEAAFIPPAGRADGGDEAAAPGVDSRGWCVEASGRSVFLLPEEAESEKRALRLARRAGVPASKADPVVIRRFGIEPAGSTPLAAP